MDPAAHMDLPATILISEGPKPAGTWSAIVTLLNCAVGAGILSYPLAFQCTGWLAGLCCTVLTAVVEAFTLYVLSRYAEHTRSSSYSQLVFKMLGPGASLAMSLIIFIYIWGSAAAYLIILGDCFTPVLTSVLGAAWFTQRDFVILAASSLCILPLCFPRSLTALAGISAITLWGLFVVVGMVLVRSIQTIRAAADPWTDVRAFSPGLQFLSALPIFVFGFQCHTNVIAVFDELSDDPLQLTADASTGNLCGRVPATRSSHTSLAPQLGHRSGAMAGEGGYTELPSGGRCLSKSRRHLKSPKLRGMMWVVLAAVGLTCCFYCCVGVGGYLAFPGTVHSNVLTNFAPDDPLMQIARAVVGVIQIASYPVMHNPARAAVRDILLQLTGLNFGGQGFNIVETLVFFSSTLVVSLMVRDLGVVFRLVGGTGGGLLIFTLPGLLLCQYAYGKYVRSREGLLEPLLAADHGIASPCGEDVDIREAGGTPEGGQQLGQSRQGRGVSWAQQRDDSLPVSRVGSLAAGLHPLSRGGSLAPGLQPLSRGGSAAAGGQVYRYWTSKLWWAGVLLVLLSVALCGLTVYTVFMPTSDA